MSSKTVRKICGKFNVGLTTYQTTINYSLYQNTHHTFIIIVKREMYYKYHYYTRSTVSAKWQCCTLRTST